MSKLPGGEKTLSSLSLIFALHIFKLSPLCCMDEIDAALRGQMITKVVYLEQPQIASSMDLRLPDAVVTLPANENVLAEADHLGRPLLIIRLGARQPSPHRSNAQFMGRSGPLRILEKSKEGGAP